MQTTGMTTFSRGIGKLLLSLVLVGTLCEGGNPHARLCDGQPSGQVTPVNS